MLKWLIFAVLIYVAVTLWKRGHLSGPEARSGKERHRPVERMVVCAHCGVYLPEGESVKDGQQRDFCCDEHRRLGARRSP